MIIDFHTHVFPDALAPKAGASLSATAGFPMFSDLTVRGQLEVMREDGVDLAVVLNTVTNTRQVEKVNLFAVETAKSYPDLIVFGSVHPRGENPVSVVERLHAEGIRGLKLHPDYLGIPLDDPVYHPVLEAAVLFDMPVVIHAGWDPVSPEKIHATPHMIQKVLDNFPALKLVCAHMGGMRLWDEVLDTLCGKDVWFDTAMCHARAGMHPAQVRAILNKHGAEHVLFGSDMPWARPSEVLAFLEQARLSDGERDLILSQNAVHLLNL